MTIDKIAGAGNVQPSSNRKPVDKLHGVGVDRVEISEAARLRSHQEHLMSITQKSSDIRLDKVAQARERLDAYIKDGVVREEVINAMADAFTNALFDEV